MDRVPVKSSNLKSVGYDSFCRLLEVEFHPKPGETQGAIWQYWPVSQLEHDDLMEAESIGSYFHHHIKIMPDIDRRRMFNLEIAAATPEGLTIIPNYQFDFQEHVRIGRELGIHEPDALHLWINDRFAEVISRVATLLPGDSIISITSPEKDQASVSPKPLPVAGTPTRFDEMQAQIDAARNRVLEESFDISFAVFGNAQGNR